MSLHTKHTLHSEIPYPSYITYTPLCVYTNIEFSENGMSCMQVIYENNSKKAFTTTWC